MLQHHFVLRIIMVIITTLVVRIIMVLLCATIHRTMRYPALFYGLLLCCRVSMLLRSSGDDHLVA